MADFSALKTSIQNYIKQNGNEEITGNLLQQVLLSMVTTLGDSAINDLVTALNAEIANRGNADTTLQGNIDNEAAARGNADTELGGRITTLQGVVNGIKANVENGYVYAGIATPSSTPASGKVFYLALTAGTYNNFGATVVPQGINILKYNGSAWSLDSFLGLDDAPTQGSGHLVKSGGVLDSIIKDGSAFDLSAYNNGTKYADLSAALTALNALPAAYKKGGMSFKYVQTSDNNYVQYRCISEEFTINTEYWALHDNSVIVANPEYIEVKLDKKGRILEGTKYDATKIFPVVSAHKIILDGKELSSTATIDINNITDDPEGRLKIELDNKDRIISYRTSDGTLVENAGVETNSLHLSKDGMTEFQQALKDAGFQPGGGGDYSDAITNKGKKPVFIPMPHLARLNILWDGDLTTLSKSDRPDGVQKVNYDVKVECEFFDGQGVYFKKWALMSAQGNSSMAFVEKNLSLKFFDTEDVEGNKHKWGKGDTFGTVFGAWVMQKTYHLKSYYTDFLKGSAVVSYQLADEVYKTRGVYADRPWKKALIDFSTILPTTPTGLSEDGINDMNLQIDNGARCMPDGFPVIVYQNGDFYGIFCWQLKKDSDNFNLDTSESTNIHIDGILNEQSLWGGNVDWTQFEIRNPEDLICMDGSDYNGDNPAELIDSTATGIWDPTNKNHVRSAQVKQYIQNLANRVGEINALTPTYTRPDEVVITLNTYRGVYDGTTSYNRGNWVKDSLSADTYYMSLHDTNRGHTLSDTDYWHDISSEIAQIKGAFETYFDVDNMVDYQLINMACGDPDGFAKNWQWVTYNGTKWYVNQYDKDMSFGNWWTGMLTTAPKNGWINSNINLPSGLATRYYTPEHKARWQELVDAGLFTTSHIKKLIFDWVARIGKANYEQNWKKWPESPCNRESKIDFENWKSTGGNINSTPSGIIWDSNTAYTVGQKVWFVSFDEGWYLQFEAVKNNQNKPCLTEGYSAYPRSMGYRDSVWRFCKYVDRTMENQNAFINSLKY